MGVVYTKNGILGSDPLALYKHAISDDESDPQYYGFTEKDGAWYILRVSTAEKSSKYRKGASDFATAWTNRAEATPTYDYYHNIF